MTRDASGNLGVGTASPGVNGIDILKPSGTSTYVRTSDGAYTMLCGVAPALGGALIATTTNHPVFFYTNNAERARITSGGSLLVGSTSPAIGGNERFSVLGTRGIGVKSTGSATDWPCALWNSAASGDNLWVIFYSDAAGITRGSIDYNRAGGLVRYNTTSDYRAKDIIGPLQNVGETIDGLKVYEGIMKGATESRPMLIAHEAQEYAPYAVSGVKDEVNEDGTPKFQQIDVSSLVPLLLAEIQSLRARVAQLEAK